MAQQLLVKFIDNDACDEKRTPFLLLWKAWGGYTLSALDTIQGILELFEMAKEEISSIMHKPNHKSELADLLVDLMHSHCDVWIPSCVQEVGELGYNLEEDRGSYWKMTKLVLLAHGLPQSAALINKDSIWDPEGILMPTEETIQATADDFGIRDDVHEVEIGLDSDVSPWIIFRVMDAFEPSEGTIEAHYAGSDTAIICAESLEQYCDEMSDAVWKKFCRLIKNADKTGKQFLANKKENLVLQII